MNSNVRNQKRMAEKYELLASVASDRHWAGQPFASTDGLDLYEKMLWALHGGNKTE